MAAIAHDQPQQRELKLVNKLGFGFGDAGQGIVANLLGWFFNAFLLDVVGMRPALVGLIFGLSLIWDGITDPLVGVLSDRTQSRWGSKRPWLLFGAIPFGLAYILAWVVPDVSATGQFLYYLLISLLLKTAFTSVSVPYTALTPALTPDYDERTQLNFFRFGFSLLGGLIAVLAHSRLVALAPNPALGHLLSATVWAIVIIGSTWVAFLFTFERPIAKSKDDDEEQLSFVDELKLIWANKPYLMVTGIYLLSWLSLQFIQINLLLYMRYWVRNETQFPFLVLMLQVTTIVFLGVWAWVSGRIGKRHTYIIGVVLWLGAQIGLFLAQPGQISLLYVLAFFGGTGVAVAFLIPWSMIPDVIEYGEDKFGTRREGIFYGGFIFLQKFGLASVIFFSNSMLDWAGYTNPDITALATATQPDSVLLLLRLFVSLVPGVLLVLSIPLVLKYPITKEYFAEIQERLARKRRGEAPA